MWQNDSTILHTPLTIPNLLSSIRLAMAIAAGVLFATASFEVLAVLLCLAGVILDALDGWYARKFAQCSHLGRFLDPLADKILMAVVYGVIAVKMDSLVIWALFALVTGRDLVVTASRSLAMRRGGATYASDRLGKVKMIVQSTAGIGLLAYAYILSDGFTFSTYPVVAILLVITLLSYLSAGRYLFLHNSAARLNS
ncbi:MAG: CDP-alcohol phosphatidyltransferase family protein [Candidatus Krumholzibacteria bacterium]|nr:CDP-alcohol phosphatidyltransferase family protein [Candidatus Krumholzibacteria bacterium]